MGATRRIEVPLNRVEGDLEIRVEVSDGVVTDAWSSGIMYRGFENLLVGRGPLDGLVITPRICGICTTSHLMAAATALDMIAGVPAPDNARRVRNVTLMAEHLQSDMRHGFLLFAPDFANPAHRHQPLFEEAVRRYAPLAGETAVEVIRETKRILETIAILGGQWPHSSFMVPGGVVTMPSATDLLQCRHLLARYREWYEKRVLGCSLERWHAVQSAAALDAWLDESDAHRQSDLGFYIRFARAIGLEQTGKGHGNFLSFGSLEMPEDTAVQPQGQPSAASSANRQRQLVPAGVIVGGQTQIFDQGQIAEHVAYSWFTGYEGGLHPFVGETKPYATGAESQKYSWAKAPRYAGAPAETGPLAEALVGADPLISDLVRQSGPNTFVRELARLVRPATLMTPMETWLSEMAAGGGDFYRPVGQITEGEGFGLIQASRGALGHWVTIKGGKIAHYQIITPTAWNGSPRDSDGVRGPWEEALIGVEVRDTENPVEIGHVIRAFDACLVCTVHALRK